jgi:hypothetical protein
MHRVKTVITKKLARQIRITRNIIFISMLRILSLVPPKDKGFGISPTCLPYATLCLRLFMLRGVLCFISAINIKIFV